MSAYCTSGRHTEWDCMAADSRQVGWTVDMWCDACSERYRELWGLKGSE